ncbi:hypothetical protein [Oleidesulfovibrio alaskensis]|jgi:hypothetical protein|uniref:hypothetical protein n=1 Tax=Oleidesulfovibrio alaskensis TaxID=58180 RepID=UPI001A4090A4|nr:hypothetical protein [Oleidesulfovibrio alaskensis]MBL3582618.1 hypothetical protein [Oleidesulfovibrio alaskensis]
MARNITVRMLCRVTHGEKGERLEFPADSVQTLPAAQAKAFLRQKLAEQFSPLPDDEAEESDSEITN